jgi:hypothetical protein
MHQPPLGGFFSSLCIVSGFFAHFLGFLRKAASITQRAQSKPRLARALNRAVFMHLHKYRCGLWLCGFDGDLCGVKKLADLCS